MNNITAAIGLSQVPHLKRILDQHRRNGAAYREAFRGSSIIRPLRVPEGALSSYWVYSALVVDDNVDRDLLLEALNADGIAAGLGHLPNHLYSAFGKYGAALPGV